MSERMAETPATGELRRSRSNRMLSGVAGGLGACFEFHPAVFRVSFVVLTLMGGAGILIYLAAALVMPEEGKEDSAATSALRRRRPWVLVVLGLMAVVLLALLSEVPVWPQGDAWPFLLIAGALALWLTWFAVAGIGRGWLRAVGIVVASVAVLLVVLVAAFLATFDVHLGDGVDERTVAPASVSALDRRYELGLGELVFDLRSVEFPLGETRLDVRVDAGRIRVLLPEDVALRAGTEARLGEIDRLVFAVLALAGGAGILVYLALWAYARARRVWLTVLLAFVCGAIVLSAIGFGGGGIFGLALVAVGLWLALRGGRSLRPDAPVSYFGLGLAAVGVAIAVPGGTPTLLAPGAVAAALIIILGPWLWRLVRDRDAERAARVRSEERADMAARVHDSVLQTLALIQRHAREPQRVEALARRQERELRGWFYDDRPFGDAESSLVGALAAAAADVEEAHGVRVELANGGGGPPGGPVEGLVLAAREAMRNAAKFADTERIDVYAEVTDDAVAVFVHDRGAGFDRAAVPPDRRGLVDSIEGRLERAGGQATNDKPPGEGTEVELRLPRRSS